MAGAHLTKYKKIKEEFQRKGKHRELKQNKCYL